MAFSIRESHIEQVTPQKKFSPVSNNIEIEDHEDPKSFGALTNNIQIQDHEDPKTTEKKTIRAC